MQATPFVKKNLVLYGTSSADNTERKKTQLAIAERLSKLLNLPLLPHSYSTAPTQVGAYYYLPEQLLVASQAAELGIQSTDDLYGGVVPFDFLLTNTLSYPLHQPTMAQPEGWNNQLGLALRPYVPVGYSAFNTQDALWTARGLLHKGPVRLIVTHTDGKAEEMIVNNHLEISDFLDQAEYQPLFERGVVITESPQALSQFIVGQTKIHGLTLSYLAEKKPDNDVNPSLSLCAVKGDYEELSTQLHSPYHLKALHLAQQYENIVFSYFPEIYTSRRAYKLIQSNDFLKEDGLKVKEPLWHMDESSIIELEALGAFLSDESLRLFYT